MTGNLRFNAYKLDPEDIISVADKLHGTSFIVSNILTNKPKTIRDTIAGWFGVNVVNTVYDIIWASRKVVKNKYISPNVQHFYDSDIWGIVAQEVKNIIPKGVTLYGEIVGFLPSGAAIQKCLEGVFDYGCQEFTHRSYIYRITHTDPDGHVTEYSYQQILDFCSRYGLNTPYMHFYGKAKDMYPELDVSTHWNENLLNKLESVFMKDQDCPLCKNTVPYEGIVISRETLYTRESFKLKTFRFLNKAETEMLDAGVSDIETEQSLEDEEET